MEKRGMKFDETDVPLILNSYEDIFSNFDPRPYPRKAMSKEFLSECEKASLDKKKVNLKLFVPEHRRKISNEVKIKRRLQEHFKKHAKLNKDEIKKTSLIGFLWFVAGTIMIVLTVFLDFSNPFSLISKGTFWTNLIIIITQPAGWFFMWEGLGQIFITSREKMPNYLFYKKMANADISFFSC